MHVAKSACSFGTAPQSDGVMVLHGYAQIVAPAGKAPKGKRAGGTKQPVPGTPAAAKAWAYERRQMAATKSGVTVRH